MIFNIFLSLLIRKGKKKVIIYAVSFSLFFMLIAVGYHMYRVKQLEIRNTAVIVNEDVALRSGPGENNTILFRVSPGIKVNILDRSRNWFHISASAEIAGWIRKEAVAQI